MSLVVYKRAFKPIYFQTKKNDTLITSLYAHFQNEIPIEYLKSVIDSGGVYHRGPLHTFPSLKNVPLPRRVFNYDEQIERDSLLKLFLFPRYYSTDHVSPENLIIFENDEFMVIDKPHAISIGPVIDNFNNNINHFIKENIKPELSTIYNPHRLDFQTRGLCVLVKDPHYISQFNLLLRNRDNITKKYRAYYMGNDENDLIDLGLYTHYMKPSKSTIKEMSSKKIDSWHECILRVLNRGKSEVSLPISDNELNYLNTDFMNNNNSKQIDNNNIGKGEYRKRYCNVNLNYVDLELITGRTHQIRAQLSTLGKPLIGDRMYGGLSIQSLTNPNFSSRDQPYPYRSSLHSSIIGLVSYELSFKCPKTGKDYFFSLDKNK